MAMMVQLVQRGTRTGPLLEMQHPRPCLNLAYAPAVMGALVSQPMYTHSSFGWFTIASMTFMMAPP